ncbi:putative signal peptide protein [Puccinia sorghi]|uniref:Putative signal peptide protein n=1 Tax=Puccinia sorghi TaxID=27349 RepID=A0A0L6VG29_9BASI|nr:putative signal peptide protein [Puccinia sorghi]
MNFVVACWRKKMAAMLHYFGLLLLDKKWQLQVSAATLLREWCRDKSWGGCHGKDQVVHCVDGRSIGGVHGDTWCRQHHVALELRQPGRRGGGFVCSSCIWWGTCLDRQGSTCNSQQQLMMRGNGVDGKSEVAKQTKEKEAWEEWRGGSHEGVLGAQAGIRGKLGGQWLFHRGVWILGSGALRNKAYKAESGQCCRNGNKWCGRSVKLWLGVLELCNVLSWFSYVKSVTRPKVKAMRRHCLARYKGTPLYLTRQCVHVAFLFGLLKVAISSDPKGLRGCGLRQAGDNLSRRIHCVIYCHFFFFFFFFFFFGKIHLPAEFFTLKRLRKYHQIYFNLTPKKINEGIIFILRNLTCDPHLCTTNWFRDPPGPMPQCPVVCASKKEIVTKENEVEYQRYEHLSHHYILVSNPRVSHLMKISSRNPNHPQSLNHQLNHPLSLCHLPQQSYTHCVLSTLADHHDQLIVWLNSEHPSPTSPPNTTESPPTMVNSTLNLPQNAKALPLSECLESQGIISLSKTSGGLRDLLLLSNVFLFCFLQSHIVQESKGRKKRDSIMSVVSSHILLWRDEKKLMIQGEGDRKTGSSRIVCEEERGKKCRKELAVNAFWSINEKMEEGEDRFH